MTDDVTTDMTDDPCLLPATELVARYRAGSLSPVAVTEACLARIKALNLRLNAFCLVDEAGALAAAEASAARWAAGAPLGAPDACIDGVPTSIKDVLLAQGWPCLRGSKTIDPNQPWDEDAPAVARLREAGAVLMRAIEAAADALYREKEDYDPEASPRQRRREAERRRADAAELVGERALAAGFGGGDGNGAEDDLPVSGSRAERYQVFLHVDRDTLSEEGEPGRSEMEDGTRVSGDTSRRLSCDVGLVGVLRGEAGEVLDVGRKRRTVPPALRRALEVRDRGCRFPGCGLRFTDAHHITHWADGGATSLENCVLLCRRHHRFVHEENWTVEWWGENRAVFRDPRGGVHLEERPDPPELPDDPVRELEAENRRRGIGPGPLTAGARWTGRRQVPDEIWYAALEAGFAAVDRVDREDAPP